MVTSIPDLPQPPTRATQPGEQFVIVADAFLAALLPWTQALNVFGGEMEALAGNVTVELGQAGDAALAAANAADRAEAAAGFRVSIAYSTWSALSGVTGTEGQSAAVFDDEGTHTDPVVGGTVDNAGLYRWSTSPAGWQRIADLQGEVNWADITGKPTSFTPAAHGHAIEDVDGLSDALAGKQATGDYVTLTGVQSVSDKTISASTIEGTAVKPRAVGASATNGTMSPNADQADVFIMEGLDGAVTIGAPTGTPTDGQKLMLRIQDDGNARALTWTTGSAGAYRAVGAALPTTTVAGRTLYAGCIWNGTAERWDVVAVAQEEA